MFNVYFVHVKEVVPNNVKILKVVYNVLATTSDRVGTAVILNANKISTFRLKRVIGWLDFKSFVTRDWTNKSLFIWDLTIEFLANSDCVTGHAKYLSLIFGVTDKHRHRNYVKTY